MVVHEAYNCQPGISILGYSFIMIKNIIFLSRSNREIDHFTHPLHITNMVWSSACLGPRPLCWAFSWGKFVANAFFVDRFLEFFLMEGLFCRPFLWNFFCWTVCFVDRFLGERFLVKGLFCRPFFLVNSLFCRPFSWRMFFGERFVLQTVFMENVFWWKACFVERFHGECCLVKGLFCN